MKQIFAATAALGLALTAVSATAQDDMDMDGDMMEMSMEQETMYDGWPADRQSMYDAWPDNAKTYFWKLEPMQMDGWWMLTDDQRARIVAMNPQQQMAAWQSINAQVSGATGSTAMPAQNTTMSSQSAAMPAQTTSMPARTSTMPAQSAGSMNGNMRFVSNEMVQSAPAPHNGEYPLCADGRTDNCMNPWEAGKRGRGVARPLDYWPGKPASEM